MSFGRMPIANGFLTADEIDEEYFFELSPAFCERCFMFQLIEQPDPARMFHDHYAFVSGTSRHMQRHFKEFAGQVTARVLKGRTDPLVVEIGSNDGIMLRNLKDAGVRHLGVEPSSNVAQMARDQGIETVVSFFDAGLAGTIAEKHGQADCVLAANVMCHIPDLADVAEGVDRLLAPDGMFIFEDPYLGDMLAKTSYDQIYDEHVFIFSVTSVASAFSRWGLELIDVHPQPTHGGSMRYTLARTGRHEVSEATRRLRAEEDERGFSRLDTYDAFRRDCESSRDSLMDLLEKLRVDDVRVVGYGATSKSTTVTNYCGITPDHIEFISDTTPTKQGKFSPGAHIPVRPYEDFVKDYPDFAVLFAWNHAAEISEKEEAFLRSGGRWITFVPEVGVTP
jgi:methylation protein EvaC